MSLDTASAVQVRTRHNTLMAIYAQHVEGSKPGASVDSTIWQQISESNIVLNGTPDPVAIRMAYEIHVAAKPILTILHGSRARGDHFSSSDIDILVVTQNPCSRRLEAETLNRAQNIVLKEYSQSYKAQVLWDTWERYTEQGQWADTLTTRALIQGVVFADHPERYVSRYGGEKPEIPRYCWQEYEHFSRFCQTALNRMHMVVTGRPKSNEWDSLSQYYSVMHKTDSEKEIRETLSNLARNAIDYACRTVISGAGGYAKIYDKQIELDYGLSFLRTRLKLAKTLPCKEFKTERSLEDYSNAQFPDISNEELLETTINDCKVVRSHATRLRRNATKRMKESSDNARN